MPPLEWRGKVLRRGRFALDLAAKHDDNVNGPVLDVNDMATLWEITGMGKAGFNAYRTAVICGCPVLDTGYFSGNFYGNTPVGSSKLYVTGRIMDFYAATSGIGAKFTGTLRLWRAEGCNYYVVVNTAEGRRYWAGNMFAVVKIAKLVDSVLLSPGHFCGDACQKLNLARVCI